MICNFLSLRSKAFLGISCLLLVAPSAFAATLNSNTAQVTLNATLSESLTVSTTAATINFALVAGQAATGDNPIPITTTWVLGSSRSSVTLSAYFSSPTAALTHGTDNIPSSAVFGQVGSGTFSAFTAGTVGSTSAGLDIFTQTISSSNFNSSHSDTLNLKIDLTGQQVPAASYTGTLNLQAQAL